MDNEWALYIGASKGKDAGWVLVTLELRDGSVVSYRRLCR